MAEPEAPQDPVEVNGDGVDAQPPEEERSGAYMDYKPSDDPLVKGTARKVRAVGYVVAVILILWLTVPIIITVVQNSISGQVYDPQTGRLVASDLRQPDCERWAFELFDAPASEARTAALPEWRTRCAELLPELDKRLK